MLTIPAPYLKAALTHAGDRDIRGYLNCVRVEVVSTGDVYIVATDGARLFAGRIPAANVQAPALPLVPMAVSIPRDTVKRALSSRIASLTLRVDPLALGDVSFVQPDGVYPDWRRVVPPAEADAAPADFHWQLLADAESALRTWCGKPHMLAHTSIRGENPALVTCSDENVFAVVMPARLKADAPPFAQRFEPIR